MNIGIIDIGIGNLRSIQNMFSRLGYATEFIRGLDQMRACDKLVLPGMGYFDKCMSSLNESGMRDEMELQVLQHQKPFLGICVGMQMLMRRSDEGQEKGLNWIAGDTVGFDQSRLSSNQKIPNLGWLDVDVVHSNALNTDWQEPRFYFAHSYHAKLDDPADEWISATYGYPFTAAVKKAGIYGVQFHPEKSHKFGMALLKNFAALA